MMATRLFCAIDGCALLALPATRDYDIRYYRLVATIRQSGSAEPRYFDDEDNDDASRRA